MSLSGRKNSAIRSNLDDCIFVAEAHDQAGDVASLFDSVAPILVFVTIELAEVVAKDVRKIALPTVAAFVAVQAIAQRLVGDALQVNVQRRVDAQAALVDGFGAVGGFEILANFLEEVWRQVVAWILDVQTERGCPGCDLFLRLDL